MGLTAIVTDAITPATPPAMRAANNPVAHTVSTALAMTTTAAAVVPPSAYGAAINSGSPGG